MSVLCVRLQPMNAQRDTNITKRFQQDLCFICSKGKTETPCTDACCSMQPFSLREAEGYRSLCQAGRMNSECVNASECYPLFVNMSNLKRQLLLSPQSVYMWLFFMSEHVIVSSTVQTHSLLSLPLVCNCSSHREGSAAVCMRVHLSVSGSPSVCSCFAAYLILISVSLLSARTHSNR